MWENNGGMERMWRKAWWNDSGVCFSFLGVKTEGQSKKYHLLGDSGRVGKVLGKF